nr:MAG TPA: hypothetical protein [Caudoviricetes sp.]
MLLCGRHHHAVTSFFRGILSKAYLFCDQKSTHSG